METCPTCNGRGRVRLGIFRKATCQSCGGTGRVPSPRRAPRSRPESATAPLLLTDDTDDIDLPDAVDLSVPGLGPDGLPLEVHKGPSPFKGVDDHYPAERPDPKPHREHDAGQCNPSHHHHRHDDSGSSSHHGHSHGHSHDSGSSYGHDSGSSSYDSGSSDSGSSDSGGGDSGGGCSSD